MAAHLYRRSPDAVQAETAEVSTRTLYQHFPTRTALVEECPRRYEPGPDQRIEQYLSPEGLTPEDQLPALFSMVAEADRACGSSAPPRREPVPRTGRRGRSP
ncbi:hypothetical protein [Streptomyces sp. NPDC006012]|uniref:hypothetical protein n=1 Tax=Streptomyces sp. NPDC006012 TaxID=3364739 RepID=UPI0036B81A96